MSSIQECPDRGGVILSLHTQRGDSATIIATVKYRSETLKVLVEAGPDLNLFNEVRYTVTVDTAPHIIHRYPY